ncbi:hypothetical protein FB639_004565, partial [Coemansia asiatica]
MAGIPLFLQRIGRGTVSLDEHRSHTLDTDKTSTIAITRNRRSMDLMRNDIENNNKSRRGRLLSSPKFFAKVAWVDTLSQLANMVPLNQINIPQPVY